MMIEVDPVSKRLRRRIHDIHSRLRTLHKDNMLYIDLVQERDWLRRELFRLENPGYDEVDER